MVWRCDEARKVRRAWRRAVAVAGVLAVALTVPSGGPAVAQGSGQPPSVDEFGPRVQTLAETELIKWIQDPVVIRAIIDANKINASMTPEQIERLDQEWRRQTDAFSKPMIFDLLDRQASIILRDRRETSGGVITEIIVMDKWGLNAAISDPTSDFFQGDEAKYLDTYPNGKGAVHVGEYEYDDSTEKWQTQVSLTVVDPDDGDTPIGAVTFGVDLERLPTN